MKAISPALPTTTPARQSSGADASAAADAFSALIAAVIGAPVTGSTPAPAATSSSQPSTRVDKVDDAQPSAATSRTDSNVQTADGTAKSAADAPRSSKPSDGTGAPQTTTHPSETKQTESPKSAPSPKLDTSNAAPTPATVPSAPGQPKLPVGLEKAAAALAQALAASSEDPTTAASLKALPTQPTAAVPATKPGSALTEGQLPAQLVAATHSAGISLVTSKAQNGKTADPVRGVGGQPVVIEAKSPAPTTPVVTPPVAGTAAAQALASTQVAKPQASSDVVAVNTSVTVTAPTTGDHRKSDPKTATPDRPSIGDATPHFDLQLSAQPAAPSAQQVTSVAPAPQAQPAYTSGMVSQQLVQVVAPFRTAKEGDYTLSLQLHPADLGAVTVRVEVQQGVLSVHLSAEHAHGHEALNQSLTDLRTQLQSSGVRTGDIVVAAKPSATPQHQDLQQHTGGGRHQPEAPVYDDAGADRRPGDRPAHHAQSQADDDTVDVRI